MRFFIITALTFATLTGCAEDCPEEPECVTACYVLATGLHCVEQCEGEE